MLPPAIPTVVVEGPDPLITGADVESGYLSNEYSQTILRPDKTRVDQPTVLVG